jgi:DNA invertase Pin-like site-specific DNA recombinase
MGLVEDTPTGRLVLTIMMAFAEYERDMIIERLNDGKAEAKAKNPDYREGRKYIEIPEFESYKSRVANGDMTVTVACKQLGISRSKWYKEVGCRA